MLYFYRHRVKTEASFTAEDPWNQNRRAPFTVEDYVLGPRGYNPGLRARPAADYLRSIRSGVDGVERKLPDSLSELWRDKRVPAEALPWLLKEMEPTLVKSDYKLLIRSKFNLAMAGFAWVLVGVSCLMPFFDLDSLTYHPSSYSIPVALGIAGAGWLYMYLLFYRKRWRRTRQMKWILARLEALKAGLPVTRGHLLPLDINPQDGTIRLPNGFVVAFGMTQDAFRASAMFGEAKSEDHGTPPWIHYRFPGGVLEGKNVSVSLCFHDQMLVSVDLAADLYPPGPRSWSAYSLQTEAATKDFHDRLLEYLFAGSTREERFDVTRLSEDEAILKRPVNWPFPWGRVCSSHDPRGDYTSITVSYGNRYAEAVNADQARIAPGAESSGARSSVVQRVISDARFAGDLGRAKLELALGNRTKAIRLARESTGMSLREAQDLMDLWEKKE